MLQIKIIHSKVIYSRIKKLCIGLFFCMTSPVYALDDIGSWLTQQEKISVDKMLKNVSPAGAIPGVIIASPEKKNPPYFYHWTRDSALTMDTIISLYQESNGQKKESLRKQIMDYIRFSQLTQKNSRGNIGEPKYNVDGSPYAGDWCRPQNDGPATRVIALSRFADILLQEGNIDFVKTNLYDGHLPTNSVIKTDLEYISHHWSSPDCDLWEEVVGNHFYTRMLQRTALLIGKNLAQRLNDPGASEWYAKQAQQIENTLSLFWDSEREIFVPTIQRTGGLDYKASKIDASVIMALLHGDSHDGFFSYRDKKWISTFQKIKDRFAQEYAINKTSIPGIAIGRYPEDKYGGTQFNTGNPWVLLTAGFGRFCYNVAAEYLKSGDTVTAQTYMALGDDFLRRVRAHANPDGSLSEQMDRNTGYMVSAPDLTWSYVEVIQASWARAKLNRSGLAPSH